MAIFNSNSFDTFKKIMLFNYHKILYLKPVLIMVILGGYSIRINYSCQQRNLVTNKLLLITKMKIENSKTVNEGVNRISLPNFARFFFLFSSVVH